MKRYYSLALLPMMFCWSLVGCRLSLTNDVEPTKYYVLKSITRESAYQGSPKGEKILIRDTTTSALIKSQRILVSDEPLRRASYQYAFWGETPPQAFQNLLQQELEQANLFSSVAKEAAGALAPLQLNTEILDFYHNAAKSPGAVEVKVRVELLDLKTREIIAARVFSSQSPVSSYDAVGAVDAFSIGVSQVLTEIIAWLDQIVSSPAPSRQL